MVNSIITSSSLPSSRDHIGAIQDMEEEDEESIVPQMWFLLYLQDIMCYMSHKGVQQARKKTNSIERHWHKSDLILLPLEFFYDLISILLWEAALAYWKVNMVQTFTFLTFQNIKVSHISSFMENILKKECYNTTSLFPRGTALVCCNMCRVFFLRLVNGM